MNITDVDAQGIEVPGTNEGRLEGIFNTQLGLMIKYHHIESRNGFHIGESTPLDLDHKHDQHRLKDFSWRILEEVAEALEALELRDQDHYEEELIDALHFLVELCILSGFNPGKINLPYHRIPVSYGVSNFVKELGCAMNCLKNKPWKQTHIRTDQDKYIKQISRAWDSYMQILKNAGFDDVLIFILYTKKSEVNKFRQRSSY